jgi:hypothetical protein
MNVSACLSVWLSASPVQGFMKKVPNLLKQAGNGIACALRVLFRLYTPDVLDGTGGAAAAAAAAAGDGGSGDGVGGGEGAVGEVLPPEEVEARQGLAEGCVCLQRQRQPGLRALPSLAHAHTHGVLRGGPPHLLQR